MRIAKGADDPRLHEIDDDFRELLAAMAPMVAAGSVSGKRFFHATATTLRGTARILGRLDLPAHGFFCPGRRFGVLARYSSGFGNDDVAPAVRGVTLRLLDSPQFTDATDGALDVLLNTAECFFVPTADAFRRAQYAGPMRDDLVRNNPHFRVRIWQSVRKATSFATYPYYSQAPTTFTASDGTLWFARYRLLPDPKQGGRRDDLSTTDPGELWMPPHPPDKLPRDPEDRRLPTHLHDDLSYRVAVGPVCGMLQVQLHPGGESVLDATRPWPPATYPWRDLAEVKLDAKVRNETVEGLRFSPAVAPPELGIALAHTPYETASLNHLRALVYQQASSARCATL